MNDYLELLQNIDSWFATVLSRCPTEMQCARGCALCCHGLFDISMPDAVLLSQGLGTLPPEVLQEAVARAAPVQAAIVRLAPELKAPFLLDQIPEGRIDEIVDQATSPPCPLLGSQQECLVYEYRPLACRLEGVPMVDTRDGLFGDWCELNFTNGVPSGSLDSLTRDYVAMQEAERRGNEIISETLWGEKRPRATVFIASLLDQYDNLWR